MKIGIVTQPLFTNYGGILQNYALQKVLFNLGHESITLDQHNPTTKRWKIYAACIKNLILNIIDGDKTRVYPLYLGKNRKSYIQKNTDYFINKYINRSKKLRNKKEFRFYTKKLNLQGLIVGSDQVWRPKYCNNVLRSFLDFSEGMNLKRIAYAASFGVEDWEFTELQTLVCKRLIKDFDNVSVREKSAMNLCEKYLSCKSEYVLDPTLLLDKNDYIKLVENEKEIMSKGNLFAYILDKDTVKQNIIDQVAEILNLRAFYVMPKNTSIDRSTIKDIDSCVYPAVTQWLRAFMDTKFVVCDSFHGAVFSIIFNKPFLIIGNKNRGMTRFNSLLETFELTNRMITSSTDVQMVINTPIDWAKVNDIRVRLKNSSIEFLKTSLKR